MEQLAYPEPLSKVCKISKKQRCENVKNERVLFKGMENNITLQKINEYTYVFPEGMANIISVWATAVGLHPDSAPIPNGIGYRMNDIRYRIVCMNMRTRYVSIVCRSVRFKPKRQRALLTGLDLRTFSSTVGNSYCCSTMTGTMSVVTVPVIDQSCPLRCVADKLSLSTQCIDTGSPLMFISMCAPRSCSVAWSELIYPKRR